MKTTDEKILKELEMYARTYARENSEEEIIKKLKKDGFSDKKIREIIQLDREVTMDRKIEDDRRIPIRKYIDTSTEIDEYNDLQDTYDKEQESF